MAPNPQGTQGTSQGKPDVKYISDTGNVILVVEDPNHLPIDPSNGLPRQVLHRHVRFEKLPVRMQIVNGVPGVWGYTVRGNDPDHNMIISSIERSNYSADGPRQNSIWRESSVKRCMWENDRTAGLNRREGALLNIARLSGRKFEDVQNEADQKMRLNEELDDEVTALRDKRAAVPASSSA
jgi:hypothetical protein